jgi:adenylate cyclase
VLLGAVARKRAYEAAGQALQLDADHGRAYAVLGILQVVDRAHDEAIASARKAVALDAGSAEAHLNLALVLTFGGRPAEALASMETVLRLNPKAPRYVHDYHAWILFMNHRYEEAVEALGSGRDGTRGYFAAETLAMANAQLGRLDAAREALAALYQRWPANNLAYYRVLYAHYRRKEDLAFHLDALRKAGMPEWPYGHEEHEEDRLDAAAIRSLAFGRTWTGRTEEGLTFVQEIASDGTVAFRSSSASMVGTASVEGDRLCLQYPGFLLGRRHCGLVYRHARKTPGENGQYVYVNVDTIKYFSVAP